MLHARIAKQISRILLVAAGLVGATGCGDDNATTGGSTMTGGQGGQGGEGGEGGGGGQGGQGGGSQCAAAADCPTPQNECEVAACDAGVCGSANAPAGTLVTMQTAGDCNRSVCDGEGAVVSEVDDLDVPDDGADCTADACDMGEPTSTPVAAGEACDDGGGDVCNAAGQCVTTSCGDSITSGAEVCDDGNTVDCDGCRADCGAVETGCGDGFACGAEGCDDGNAVDGDGCDSNCSATACGNGVVTMGEACDDGNVTSGDGCDVNCSMTACGNGVVTMGEACDDGNATSGDGCDVNCTATACGNGVKTAGEACDDGNTNSCDGCRANCSAVETGCGDGFKCGAEACDDGNATSGDGCDANCTATACGNGVVTVGETCDDGNATSGDGCDVNCTATACGNGITTAAEACDDGDATGGDGCSASCLIEAGFSCLGTPSACSQTAELNCNNAADDDADGMMDCADTDCALGCDPLFGACAAGHSLLVFAGADLPKPVGATAAVSSIAVGGAGVVARGSVKLSITHVWDSDLDISIDAPGAPPIELSSDNGDDGDDYTNTTFNSACATPITSGSPPFSGCFAPESSLGVLFGTPLQGTWTLTANDDYPTADHGSLNAWSVAVCAAPATCGNGVVNAGEACDDGNADNTDACLTTCQLAACGDGFLQAVAGEVCDDGNTAAGDCCSPACQPAAGCGAESEPNNACGQEDGPFVPSPNLSFIGSISPVGDQDYISFTIPSVASVRIETFTGSVSGACDDGVDTVVQLRGPVCSTVIASDDDSGLNACSDINPAFYPGARQLAPGTYFVRVEDFDNDDPIGAYNVQISITSLCANGIVEPFEGCDDGGAVGGDGCSATCVVEPSFACNGSPSVCVPACGSGTLESGEECDDGNAMAGDGCSSSCFVETDYQCTVVDVPPPSVCSVAETNCGDGSDNDGDGATDLADTDCDLGNAIAACGAGQALYVYNSVNVPVDVLDAQTSTSPIVATHGGTIARAVVRLSIDHTFDGDLDISLVSPAGTTRDLSSDNGSSGPDYTATIFDNACATAITAGMPPYTGCYTPEQPLTLLNGQNPDGVWLLNVYDDASGDTGAITNWSLALCVTP